MRNEARLLVLDNVHVGQLLQPDGVLSAVREAFILHSEREGRVFPVVRKRLDTGGIFGRRPVSRPSGFQSGGVLAVQSSMGWRASSGDRQNVTHLQVYIRVFVLDVGITFADYPSRCYLYLKMANIVIDVTVCWHKAVEEVLIMLAMRRLW